MTDTTETVGDILDQIAERLAAFPNVVEEIQPAGGAGLVDVDADYGLLPPSPSCRSAGDLASTEAFPSPAPVVTTVEEETTDEESAPPVEEQEQDQEQPEKSEDDQSTQPDESESPVTPPRTIPAFLEPRTPPAVLRKRRVLPEEDEESDLVSLRTYSMPTVLALERNRLAAADLSADLPTDMTDIQRQVCRPITPVLGEVVRTPSCFMSDTEGEETDNEGGAEEEEESDADDEAEEAGQEEQEEIHPEERLMIKMPVWIFGLTCAAMTFYLTFVIYLLSWQCRFPMPGARGH